MDWNQCLKKRIAKEVSKDKSKSASFKEIIDVKIRSAGVLPEDLYYAKIVLLYDALRTLLEITALQEGYKIYNHECYTAFLKEILKMSKEGDLFDELRKVRNNINYYGMQLSHQEASEVIKQLKALILEFK